MKKGNIYIDWMLIKRVHNSIATNEEQVQYDNWLSSDIAHQEFIDDTNTYYNSSKSFTPLTPERLLENRTLIIKAHRRRKILKFRRISIVAALISISFIVSYNLLINKSVNDVLVDNNISHMTNIEASKLGDVVTLKTSSGQKYNLEGSSLVSNAKSISIDNKEISYVESGDNSDMSNKNIEYHTIYVPKSRDWKVTLSDNTVIYLNSNSELKYPDKFVAGEKRVVYLTGEAYFDVTKNEDSQFIVKTQDVDIAVYGTEFNVNTYINNIVETVLINGSVAIVDSLHNKTIFIEPKQKATYKKGEDIKVEEVDMDIETLWMRNILLFDNIEMHEIIEILSNYHDIDVTFDNERVKNIKVYCKIPKDTPLDNILDAISRSGRINYELQGAKLLLW